MEKAPRRGILADIDLAIREGFPFHQTRSNAIVLQGTLPAYCIPKVEKLKTGDVLYERRHLSLRSPPKISLKHDHNEARKNKETTYPELGQGNGRAHLVVIAGEVGGRWSSETKRWSSETKNFLWCLACEKALSASSVFRGSARAAWYRRWSCLLACAAAKAFASSLVGKRGSPGAGNVPSVHQVLGDSRREV